MSRSPKTLAAMNKNLTDVERAARTQAESEILPEREEVRLVPLRTQPHTWPYQRTCAGVRT